jgi:hypothetical protein
MNSLKELFKIKLNESRNFDVIGGPMWGLDDQWHVINRFTKDIKGRFDSKEEAEAFADELQIKADADEVAYYKKGGATQIPGDVDLWDFRRREEEEEENEPRRQRQEQTQRSRTATAEPTDDVDLGAFQRSMDDQMHGTQDVPAERPEQERGEQRQRTLRQAGAARTRQATANINMPDSAGEKLSFLQRLGLEDEISDEEAAAEAGYNIDQDNDGYIEPRQDLENVPATIENMPAKVNNEIATAAGVQPEWHQVRNLPGYLKAAIRALGRQVFGSFTDTRIEDIQVVANLGESGEPNSAREMNAVAGWLQDQGTRDTDGEMNFQQSIPDYGADFKIYSAEGYTFMIVKDEYGDYIYSWPTADNKLIT